MLDFAQARRMMVDCQLRTFDVNDLPLLAAFDAVPRERFVPTGRESLAYSDQQLSVADGIASERREMLVPMVLARMIQALDIEAGTGVLDVACGLGYSSALLHRLGAAVVALESIPALAEAARQRLSGAGVTVITGPLDRGAADFAPFDAILVNGAVATRPQALLGQLADGGRLVCVQGSGRAAGAMLYVRSGDAFSSRTLFDAAAPLLAEFRAEPGFVF